MGASKGRKSSLESVPSKRNHRGTRKESGQRRSKGMAETNSRSSFVECPVCGKSFSFLRIEEHVWKCSSVPTAQPNASSTPPQTTAAELHEAKPLPSLAEASDPAPTTPSDGLERQTGSQSQVECVDRNAFQHMMQAAREQGKRERFHLHYEEEYNEWSWFWTTGDRTVSSMMQTLDHLAPVPTYRASGSHRKVQHRMPPAVSQCAWKSEMSLRPSSGFCCGSLLLTTNLAPADASRKPQWCSRAKSSLSPSMLKSAVQKNVRLMRPESALACSVELLRCENISKPGPGSGFFELVRRECIICVEDALLHPQFPILSFFAAAASKGYIPDEHALLQCLSILHDLAAVPIRDLGPEPNLEACSSESEMPASQSMCRPDVACLTGEEECMINSLLLRAALGGMKGDVQMLRAMARAWRARFGSIDAGCPSSQRRIQNEMKLLQQKIGMQSDDSTVRWIDHLRYVFRGNTQKNLKSLEQAGSLEFKDVPLSSVDFHCSSVVDALLGEREMKRRMWSCLAQQGPHKADCASPIDEEALSERIRRCIWLFRSSTNKKV